MELREDDISETLATFEAVQSACRQLTDEGLPVSANRIVRITGGSKATVLDHLQVIRGGGKAAGGEPDTTASLLHAAADPFLKKIWAAARQQADADFGMRIRELETSRAGLLEDIRDLHETTVALAKDVAQAKAEASAQQSQEEQLARLIDIVEGLKTAGTKQSPEPSVLAAVPPDQLPLTWALLDLVQSGEALQGQDLDRRLGASGYKEASIRKAKADALEEGLLDLKVTKKGRDMLRALEGLSGKIVANDRKASDAS